jgi:hypothetical protein
VHPHAPQSQYERPYARKLMSCPSWQLPKNITVEASRIFVTKGSSEKTNCNKGTNKGKAGSVYGVPRVRAVVLRLRLCRRVSNPKLFSFLFSTKPHGEGKVPGRSSHLVAHPVQQQRLVSPVVHVLHWYTACVAQAAEPLSQATGGPLTIFRPT